MCEKIVDCPVCGGDGKERCDNPDHGFIPACGGDVSRLGCPVCGHDPLFRVPDGGDCHLCDGSGQVAESVCVEWGS
jgi:hypothetical protein